MPLTLLATLLLLAFAASAPTQPLELLALIEQNNPELMQQRRLLGATAAGTAGTGEDAAYVSADLLVKSK